VVRKETAAPLAAGGLGLVVLGLGAVWAISKVKGPIQDIYKGAEAVIRTPGEFGAGLITGREEVSITKYQFDPDLPTTHFTVEGSGVTVTNPSPNVPPPEFFKVPSATREAGIYVRGNIEDAISVSEYAGNPFKGQVPFGGPKFDLLSPIKGLFGRDDKLTDAKYSGEPVAIAPAVYRGEPVVISRAPYRNGSSNIIFANTEGYY